MLQRISNTEKVWCVEEINGNGTLERKEKNGKSEHILDD